MSLPIQHFITYKSVPLSLHIQHFIMYKSVSLSLPIQHFITYKSGQDPKLGQGPQPTHATSAYLLPSPTVPSMSSPYFSLPIFFSVSLKSICFYFSLSVPVKEPSYGICWFPDVCPIHCHYLFLTFWFIWPWKEFQRVTTSTAGKHPAHWISRQSMLVIQKN